MLRILSGVLAWWLLGVGLAFFQIVPVQQTLHLLVGLRPDAALSNLVRDIKAGSSKFINEYAAPDGA